MNCNPSLSLANIVYVRVRSASTVEPLTVIECQDGNHTVPQPKASEQSLRRGESPPLSSSKNIQLNKMNEKNYVCLLNSKKLCKVYFSHTFQDNDFILLKACFEKYCTISHPHESSLFLFLDRLSLFTLLQNLVLFGQNLTICSLS